MHLDTCNEDPSALYEYKALLGNSARNYCFSVRVADFLPCMFIAILIPLDCIITKEIEAVPFLFRPRNFRNSLDSSFYSGIIGHLFPKLFYMRNDKHIRLFCQHY